MTIRFLSFDFDGCLFNESYNLAKKQNVIESNKAFLNKIKIENRSFSKVYTAVGSNRQSKMIDVINSPDKGSCFPAVERVSKFLSTTLDPLLLADIYGNLEPGTSYKRARDKNYQREHSDWLFDETKVTIIYAQMHKIANENPTEKISFDFFDDRADEELGINILGKLKDFYDKNQDLVPTNVTLTLHQYAGKNVTQIAKIEGSGFIDKNYQQTVKDLAEQSKTTANDGIDFPLYVADRAKPELLENRMALTTNAYTYDAATQMQLTISQKNEKAKAKFIASLNKIAKKAEELDEQSLKLYSKGLANIKVREAYYSYKNAAEAAHSLYNTLCNAANSYYPSNDKLAFKRAADEAIKKAINSELKNHRGNLKQILGYAGLALLTVATAGIGYAIAEGLNYAVNRQFFFSKKFNTDSMNKVLDLKEAVDKLTNSPATT